MRALCPGCSLWIRPKRDNFALDAHVKRNEARNASDMVITTLQMSSWFVVSVSSMPSCGVLSIAGCDGCVVEKCIWDELGNLATGFEGLSTPTCVSDLLSRAWSGVVWTLFLAEDGSRHPSTQQPSDAKRHRWSAPTLPHLGSLDAQFLQQSHGSNIDPWYFSTCKKSYILALFLKNWISPNFHGLLTVSPTWQGNTINNVI